MPMTDKGDPTGNPQSCVFFPWGSDVKSTLLLTDLTQEMLCGLPEAKLGDLHLARGRRYLLLANDSQEVVDLP